MCGSYSEWESSSSSSPCECSTYGSGFTSSPRLIILELRDSGKESAHGSKSRPFRSIKSAFSNSAKVLALSSKLWGSAPAGTISFKSIKSSKPNEFELDNLLKDLFDLEEDDTLIPNVSDIYAID